MSWTHDATDRPWMAYTPTHDYPANKADHLMCNAATSLFAMLAEYVDVPIIHRQWEDHDCPLCARHRRAVAVLKAAGGREE